MSKESETESIMSADEKNEIPAPVTTETAPENELKSEDKEHDGAGKNKNEETVTEVPFNAVDEPKESLVLGKKMDLDKPVIKSSKDKVNETNDVLLDRPRKNHSLEQKLSAIIEKACSSDLESEDLPNSEPKLAQFNVNLSLSNENLLSILQDANEKGETTNHSTTEKAAEPPHPPAALGKNFVAPRKINKKYVYKLKSKSGKVLRYTSYVPIVLKKPQINLTKIDIDGIYHLDSDPSTKENHVKRKSKTSSFVNGKKGRGRPPLAARKSPLFTTVVDQNLSDTTDNKSSELNSSFGMQTRKRKLKFMPDGRIIGAGKRQKGSSSEEISDDDLIADDPPPKESSDEDWEATGDDLRELNSSDMKISMPEERRVAKAKSKMPQSAKVTSVPGKATDVLRRSFLQNSTAGRQNSSTSKPAPTKTSVDPAQLLSTLLGVTIRASQLNVVSFKPKTIHKRHPSMQKKFLVAEGMSKMAADKLRTSTLVKPATSKSPMQNILPKSSLASNKTSSFNKSADTKTTPSPPSISSMPLRDPICTPTTPTIVELAVDVSSFDNFTDSRTVRTKDGPKKFLLQKQRLELGEGEKLNRLTVYDLVQNVFDRMPSWNLHLMPDTNTFCIAQVGRGRMGIPILKKSIELSDDLAAKIFIHQLHCKKFDGVYDTESKIFSLIGEIDSLAA